MESTYRVINNNMSILRQKASRHSIIGVLIAFAAIVIATILSGYSMTGSISLEAFVKAQKTNVVLWFLDAMPFVFAIWGQYVSTLISSEARTFVMERTLELQKQSELLEQKAAFESTHDSLTGLPNRTLFLDRLEQATGTAKREKIILGVLVLDIDRFKEVNDTLGHFSGDLLLKQVGLRLSGAIRESDTLARIGGDEFAIILQRLAKIEDINLVVQKIVNSFSSPFAVENLSLEIQTSIGVSLFPDHGKDADTLMQKADVAMYTAKQTNTDFVLYSNSLTRNSPRKLTLMGELRRAIIEDELVLHYQPKVSSANRSLHSVEALVRWLHPDHGLISPGEFIPLAERTGLIDNLTTWVLRNSLEQCAEWQAQGLATSVAVNLSSVCLLNPDFPETLIGLLSSSNFPARSLIMEITETSVIADPDRALEVINRIDRLGVKLSIDDFGTGYSSLAYLKELPVSELKIDRSFVTDMAKNASDHTIVNATIQLGHNLGMKVVAEGVETEEVFQRLEELGCDYQQGYLISKPLPPDQLFDLFHRENEQTAEPIPEQMAVAGKAGY